ncbi:glutamine amidotransferase [Nevskia soli]|uniref:glutamine amidotransferase n=1 Tax=Nevskia soli TaxID=418856 RepID=UPI0015D6FAB2|nr:glutamine amidotransferase [Nevskia soli]
MFELLFKYPPAVFSRGHYLLLAPLPVWVLLLLVIAGGALLFWNIRRHAHLLSQVRRITIWSLETALIALLLLLLWHPAISVATLRPQQNIVAVLLDSSRSMAIKDEDGQTRFDAASKLLHNGLLDSLGRRFQVRLYRFGADAERVDQTRFFQPPDANVTRIAQSLRDIATESTSLPFGAAILLTDGAENAGGIDFATIQRLRQTRIPVNTIGFGKDKLRRDVEVEDFAVPQRTLAGSRIEARVALHQTGCTGEKARVTVADGDKILASETVDLTHENQAVPLVLNAGPAGALNLVARVDPLPNEDNVQNNALSRLVNVSGRKPRVLYVEGEPRWEYKFIRRAADDDPQIQLVSMLRTTPNKIYRQGVSDPSELEAGFPAKPEELFAYDGLIIGSTEANWFTPAQQDMIKEFAGRRGGGVLFLGGRFALSDGGYGATPIAEMLPVHLPATQTTFQRVYSNTELAPAGLDSALTRIDDDPVKNEQRWKKMPEIANWQAVGDPKPGAAVLAEIIPPGHRKTPLLTTEAYGRGRTAVLATGGMWRWQMRSEHTDKTLASFWQQMTRWLVNDTPGTVSASTPKQVLADEDKVPLRVEVRDKTYQPLAGAVVQAHFIGPDGVNATLQLQPAASETGVYTGEWTAPRAGAYLAEVTASNPSGEIGRDVVTFRRDDGVAENFRSTQNRDLLEKLSAQTGGHYYTPREARHLADEIAYSEAGISEHELLDLWDMPIVLLLALGLRGSEWLLRRRWGIV